MSLTRRWKWLVLRSASGRAFTQTLGGGYFFLPGIKALEFFVKHGARPPLSDPA